MDRNALDPEPRPSGLFGSWVRDNLGSGSPVDRRLEWAKNNPDLAAALYRALSQSLLGLRSSGGAAIGRDNVLAGQNWRRAMNERPYVGTGDITGGLPNASAATNAPNWAPFAESSAGLSMRRGMGPASIPDQMMVFPETIGLPAPRRAPPEAANMNRRLQIIQGGGD